MAEPEQACLAGMTVNERLYELDLLDQFTHALQQRDRDELVALYRQIEVSGAEQHIDMLLAQSTR